MAMVTAVQARMVSASLKNLECRDGARMMLDEKTAAKLRGVHPDLIKVVTKAFDDIASDQAEVAFIITEGVRSIERQRKLLKAGATRTLKSRHLTGHAVDLAVTINGEVHWDWPLYTKLAQVMKRAAGAVNVPIEWGGDWRSFKDGPHFQLPWKQYP
jgi:peptidoglycan L-alanyl-D-glutamate endopeptidase CwlK